MDFKPNEGDLLDFGGQKYMTQDTSSGIVITLSDTTGPTGHVTLWQVHSFSTGWLVNV